MAEKQRIKGQETEVLLIADGQIQDTIDAVQNFEIELQLEILKEGYLGEKSMRRDEIFNGVSGKMDLHFSDQTILKLAANIIQRAQRRTAGYQVNVKTTLNFPGGDRPRIVLPNVSFGALPINFGSRQDYGKATLNFETSTGRFLTS